ncbi:MAG: spore coat protein [Aristaeellaceae bacterium]
MNWTQKETSLLKDLKDQEKLCVEKYGEYAARANDPELRSLFEDIRRTEQQHLQTVCTWLGEQLPQTSQKAACQQAPAQDIQQAMEADKYLCQDALCTEKEVSGAYNTSIFEFRDPQVRQQLHQIQGAEQKHGEMLYQYMSRNGMYQAQ